MDLLLIGGVSGSGKSVALAAFEDAGYYAVNNLPPPLLVETARYLARRGQSRVAVALDVKTGPGLPGLEKAIDELGEAGWNVRFLYLDAKVDTLVKRFSETRRRHPFSSNERTLTEAIEYERALLAEVRPLGIVFDTSDLPAAALRAWIREFISVDPSKLTLTLRVVNLVAGRYSVQWNQVMAATLLATLPVAVMFAVLQRWLVQGLTLGAVK